MKEYGRRALVLLSLMLLFAMPAKVARADEEWEDSNDSGVEVDEAMHPLPQPKALRHLKAPPSGYDQERIHHFWRHYKAPREEKVKVRRKREAK